MQEKPDDIDTHLHTTVPLILSCAAASPLRLPHLLSEINSGNIVIAVALIKWTEWTNNKFCANSFHFSRPCTYKPFLHHYLINTHQFSLEKKSHSCHNCYNLFPSPHPLIPHHRFPFTTGIKSIAIHSLRWSFLQIYSETALNINIHSFKSHYFTLLLQVPSMVIQLHDTHYFWDKTLIQEQTLQLKSQSRIPMDLPFITANFSGTSKQHLQVKGETIHLPSKYPSLE